MKYHNHKLQTNPQHCEEEPQDTRKTNQAKHPAPPPPPPPTKTTTKIEQTQSNAQQNTEQPQTPHNRSNNKSITTEPPPQNRQQPKPGGGGGGQMHLTGTKSWPQILPPLKHKKRPAPMEAFRPPQPTTTEKH